MSKDEERLNVAFTYNHAAGTYTAHLDNGATFVVDRADVHGRLQNALSLFARAVVAVNSGRWARPKRPDFVYSYNEEDVKLFDESGKEELPPLELDLEELLK